METSYTEQNPSPRPRVDWGDALTVPNFYGRQEEQHLLTQWIIQEDCRVVSVLGMGGIGKSALSVSIMHQLAQHFEVVIFRSLRDAPSCEALLDDCLQVLSPQPLSTLPVTLEQRLSLLLELLRQTRALIVLDNLECLLQEGNTKGHFRPGFEAYGLLLHRVIEFIHQSCLLLTSREKPAELRLLEGRYTSIRSLRLSGLDAAACQQLLVEKGIAAVPAFIPEVGVPPEVGRQSEQESLIEVYAGNPLALKIVAETIVDQFSGEIGQFLAKGTVIFGSINDLLNEQFVRLSPLEQTVLCWLAIAREPVILNELQALLVTPLPRRQMLLEAIDALRRRSLIESGKRPGSFTLQSVVLEYITLVLIMEGSREIQQRQLNRLIEHGLTQAHAKEYVRQTQERLLLTPLLEELQHAYGTVGTAQADRRKPLSLRVSMAPVCVEDLLLTLLDKLRGQQDSAQGYGPANLIALLLLQRGNLNGLDLSHLSIRGAYLQSVEMHDASLSGALMRDTILTEAVNATWVVAISPDGRWWAAGSLEGQVRVWEEESQTLRLSLSAHSNMVYFLAFSPDGHTLASGSHDGTVKLWDVEKGTLLWTGWQKAPHSLAFSPDGSLLASGGDDATVRLWDPQSGTALQTLRHVSSVYAVAFSPDGHLLAIGCFGGEMRLWERHQSESSTWVEILSTQTSWITSLVFAPDGRTLASAHQDQTVRLWEVASFRLLNTLSDLQAKHLAWSYDGHTLACSGSDKTIWLWDVEESRCRATLHGHTADVYSLAFAPDSSRLLSGSADGTLRVWNVESCQCVRVISGYGVSLYDLDWSPDGTHLVSGGSDTLVTIWKVSGETSPRVLRGHSWLIIEVGWSLDGQLVISCGWDKTMCLWNAISGVCVHRFEDSSALLLCVAWSPDGSWLACGTLGRGMQMWDVRARRLHWVGQPYQTGFSDVAWSPDGMRLASSSLDGNVYLWETSDGTLLQRLSGHHGWALSARWSPDGTRLASGSSGEGSGELFVWDVKTGECLRAFTGHSGQVYRVVWSPSGNQLISGDSDGMLRWWDVLTGGA